MRSLSPMSQYTQRLGPGPVDPLAFELVRHLNEMTVLGWTLVVVRIEPDADRRVVYEVHWWKQEGPAVAIR